ncbi:MAG: sigma-70 family RNA polymerase sigma factor [Ruminococcaceae bacterium]|nr:sigma-70 family RNA polymerase sigma factor [Oscillospiraceae bacterium]
MKISEIKNIVIKFLSKLGVKFNVLYISSGETLPPPLSIDEERELLLKYNTDAEFVKKELIVHNLRLVVYIAKKFETPTASAEDLISIGTIGLIKAVNTFQPDKNIKLATYASRCIENEILMYLRKVSVIKYEISIDEPLNVDWDGNELLLSDVLGSDGEEVGREIEIEDEKRLLNELVNRLSTREKQIMQMRFGMAGYNEYTQKQVADELGISQSYISRLEKRIIEKLKKQIEIANS